MKKLVFATFLTLASISLVSASMLRAEDSDQITIKDPGEFNSYQTATSQSDPQAKASALESFLQAYPQSVVKKAVLDMLVNTYWGLHDFDHTLSAASRLLQVDPNNTGAIFYSVFIKNGQCSKTQDIQACDDAAELAKRGLLVPKPADISSDDWKQQTAVAYPTFHSTIALDYAISKKDFKAAQAEYRAELMLYTDAQSQTTGLADTYQLAEAYVQPGAQDLVQAVWFYSRAWNFAPDSFKGSIDKKIKYWYTKYHGGLGGLDAIKTLAAASTFPPANFAIVPAPTAAEKAHKVVVETSDLAKLNPEDIEYILANGSKEDSSKLWGLLQGKVTAVPGVVIGATASVIKVAVSQDAKDAKTADFIVNLKMPLAAKEIPAVGYEFKLAPATALIGTYSTLTQIPATATTLQSAQIVLRDGEVVSGKRAASEKKPAAGHHSAH